VVLPALIASAQAAQYTWSNPSQTPNASWHALAMSADGTKIVGAEYGGQIWTSRDSGATWLNRSAAGNQSWLAVAISQSSEVIYGVYTGGVYRSPDFGETWFPTSAPICSYVGVATSGAKNVSVACEGSGAIYVNTNEGIGDQNTWTLSAGTSGLNFTDLKSSSDGRKLIASVWSSGVYVADDGTFAYENKMSAPLTTYLWSGVGINADGTKLIATERGAPDFGVGGNVYTSADSGASWVASSGANGVNRGESGGDWMSAAVSADGSTLIAVAFSTPTGISVSRDGGTTWALQQIPGANYIEAAVCGSGGRYVAAAYGGRLIQTVANESTLSGLAISSGTLSTAFTSCNTSYTAAVAHSVATGFTVTPTKSDSNATTVQYLGPTGTTAFTGALSVGENVIRTVVTSQNGSATSTYTVKVTRAGSADASLSALSISSGTLSPGFGSGTTSYTATVANSVSSITVTPTRNQVNATIAVNGAPVTSGSPSNEIALSVGSNTVNVVVTAQNGTTTSTYQVTVTRAAPSASADASLSALSVSSGTLSPEFASGDTSYTATVAFSVATGFTVTPTKSDSNATTVQYLGATGTTAFTGALGVGENVIRTLVIAQNGTTTSTYTVTVTRAAASSDAALSGLNLSSGTLAPEFVSGTFSYTASVADTVSTITLTPTKSDNSATTVQYLGATGSTAFTGALGVGANVIRTVVTAQNGSATSTYTVTITRAAPITPENSITWNNQSATTASSGGSVSYTDGSSVTTIPTTAPQKSGHTFIGWFTGATNGVQVTNGSFTPTSPYGSVTFYAHWSVNRTNSVGTWAWTNQSAVGAANWHALTTSADGSKLFAGVDGGGSLYRSTDYGVTWSSIAGTSGKNWFSITSNIDGTKVAAVDRGGDIWTSTDSGSTWTQRSVGAVRDWESIASSSDGVKLVAVASNGNNNGFIYTSSDSGATWSNNLAPAGTNKFTGVASSNDGTYLAATTWANGIYTSSDSGQTWTARTLPVPNAGGTTHLQAVASSGDGSRLVTGSRTYGGANNGGVIFTSADHGATWKAYSQTSIDYVNFVSNGDGSRLAAAIYGQAGVSTSADYGATWTYQSLGSSGVIPIASNIDGSLLFVGGYGGNLWTGKVPNSRVVAVLPASTSASLAAGTNIPATALSFAASGSASAVTVTPIANPIAEASTPFSVAQAKIFDISVVNITGQVTICVDGGPDVRLWHFTNSSWVDVTTSQTDTQTCGATSSFSPFATAPPPSASLVASRAAAEAAQRTAAEAAEKAAAEAAKQAARSDITSNLQNGKDLSVETFSRAEIFGINETNIAALQSELLALPEESRADINQVLKVAYKYEVVGRIGSDRVIHMNPYSFIEIGLIPADSKYKVSLAYSVRKLPATSRDTYAEIQSAIETHAASLQARRDRLAALIARLAARSMRNGLTR
jgi:uncharacterized repeat protein (TIGR02543 family)